MAAKQQSLPHYGVKEGFTRKGRVVCVAQERKDGEAVIPARFDQFPSISKAKRFMRTGER